MLRIAALLLMASTVLAGSDLVVVEEIQRRVAKAGGNAKGAISVSLSWSSHDDLDLHLVLPFSKRAAPGPPRELFFGNKHSDGGELDVDMCVGGMEGNANGRKCDHRPVENIVFARRAPRGRYKIYVKNYKYWPDAQNPGESRSIPFEVLVRFGDRKGRGSDDGAQVKLFRGLCATPNQRDVTVYEFTFTRTGEIRSHFEAEPMAGCKIERIGGGYAGGLTKRAKKKSKKAQKQFQFRFDQEKESPEEFRRKKKEAAQRKQQQKKKKKKIPQKRYSLSELNAMRMGSLKRTLKEYGGTCKACTEKFQYVKKLKRIMDKLGGSSRSEEL